MTASIGTGRSGRGVVATGPGGVDRPAIEDAVARLLAALGADPAAEHLRETPRRVAAMLDEWLGERRPFELTTFPNDEGYEEMVVVRDIPFFSVCEHHMLPFMGRAHVGYLPGARIAGLSKLARVIDHVSRGLQVQERMTEQAVALLHGALRPRGSGVVLEAEHLCMSLRGVRRPGATTVTSALKGGIRSDPRTRAEFLALCGVNHA